MTRSAKDEIIQALKRNFNIQHFEIKDDTARHLNHSESQKTGGGHFSLLIVSPDFEGKELIERHRMVYQILNKQFSSQIHALAIKALTPQEFHR